MNLVETSVNLSLEVQRASNIPNLPTDESFYRWVEATVTGRCESVEMVIRIVDLDEGLALNQKYRGSAKPTNVLAFPAALPDVVETNLLGDLVITAPIVNFEAQQQGKTPQAHWAHLVIHGVLHLLDFDHQTVEEAVAMEDIEIGILAHLGFPNPYQSIK